MRVLNILNSNHRRGAEAFGVDLAAALTRTGADVRTVALSSAHSGPTHELTVLDEGHGRWGRIARSLLQMARDSDVLIGHGARTLYACAGAGAAANRPFVYRVIGEPDHWATTPASRRRVAIALRRAAAVAVYYGGAVAPLVTQFGLPEGRVQVIAKGIRAGAFQPATLSEQTGARAALELPEGAPVILYLGALTAMKNIDQVIRAGARLTDAFTIVVGDGPDHDRLAALARAGKGRAQILRAVADPAEVLRAADVLAITSRTEGMPTVVLEAALAGIPSVATPVGGVPWMIDDGVTGRLVPLDDVDATAQALEEALRHGSEWGRAARHRCLELHDIDVVAASWRSMLDAVVEGRPSS